MNPRRSTAALVVTLTGALALGACATQEAADASSVGQVSAADRAEDLRKADARFAAMDLDQIRAVYPSAGSETPPAGLLSPSSVDRGPQAPLTQPDRVHYHAQ